VPLNGLAALAEEAIEPNGCELDDVVEFAAKGFEGLTCPEKGFETGAGVLAEGVDCAAANGLMVTFLVAAFAKGFTA